jgi:hypothetical protein
MANFEYKNIDEILSTNEPIRGSRIDVSNGRKIIVPKFEPLSSQDLQFGEGGESVELHAFLPNAAYISSLYDVNSWKIESDNSTPPKKQISLDVHRDLGDNGLNVVPGSYKVVYNFFRNIIGSANSTTKLFISDISTDRTELKLSLTNPDDSNALSQLSTFILEYLKPKKYLPPIILNFGENKVVDVINVTSDGSTTYFFVKLYDQLPADLDLYFECWVGSQILKPYIDTVVVIPEEEKQNLPYISGPNFEVDYDYWINSETDYKSWNDILSANVQTSQEILNRYISGSGAPVKLNVDFREFENFVFYSSAEERVANFFYKTELVEYYNSQLDVLNTYTGSVAANKIKVQGLKDKVIAGFDDFENWLYYETTASNQYTSQASASITPYPKYAVTGSDYHIATKEGKYKLYSSGSNESQDWYDNLITLAQNYDLKNYNALSKAIPEYLRDDGENEQFVTFVNMVAQHFDILYLYTDHILKKNLREEHPKDGLSQDLIYEATRNLGWTLSHGTQAKDLWEYALGVSGSGDPIWTGKTTTNKYLAKTEEERTKEVWRRIYNNLPYIYKTKGTARGVKALLAAYGIPQTLLTIREFGGPDNADLGLTPRAEWEKHTYYLNFSGSYPLPTRQHYIRTPWERVNNAAGNWQYPDTVTFRWKMEPNDLYPYNVDPVQTLLQKNSGNRVDWFVTMNKNGTDVEKGSINFYIGDGTTYASASITDEYLYDDVPLNLMIRRSLSNDSTSSAQTYDFFVKTNKYGKIAVERSASIVINGSTSGSYNRAWSSDGQLFIGSGSNPQTNKILSGSVFELRYWTNQLEEDSFNNHVLAARSYNGNTETSSFYDLQAQFKFWQKFDVGTTSSLISSHPDQSKSTFFSSSKSAYFYGFNSGAFESIVETYNMEVATVGNNTPFAEKVRLDSGSLRGTLSPIESVEVSAFDNFSIDSNKLMIAFSPQSVINEDIYEAIGNISIDDYFGEYSNINADEYPRLKWFAREYWQKYPNKNDFTAYINLISIFDFSVFDQIRQTLPARVNEILGLVIEPNILERSKVRVVKNFSGDSPEKTVFDTTELSSSLVPSANIQSYKSVLKIGFEDESEYDDFEGDINIETEVTADEDINVSGDVNVDVLATGLRPQYVTYITGSNSAKPNLISTTKRYTTQISSTTSSLSSEYNKYVGNIVNKSSTKLDSETNSILDYGEINSAFTMTYKRTNVQKSTIVSGDLGYGVGWLTSSNETGKSTALFSPIEQYVNDTYYSGYKFRYTSSIDLAENNYSSYSLVTSSYLNPHNLPTSIRNHRFEGSKLSGPDINVDTRNTPDGKAVVEVFFVSPNQINTDQNIDTNVNGNLSAI